MNAPAWAGTIFTTTVLAGCSGGSGASPAGTGVGSNGCNGSCADATTSLTSTDVGKVIAQGVGEAQAHGVQATFAVVDRVGNVLAVYRMGTATAQNHGVVIATGLDASGHATISAGLEGIRLPVPTVDLHIDDQAAIAKAITGAYLSSEGNAFSTRTASQIVEEHFDPAEQLQPSGPLFGVQFSQLACSDLVTKFTGLNPDAGPHRSPLGLSADPGGFPLYKNGTVVGGVGVLADGVYGADNSLNDASGNIDELIAYAATFGFAAPVDRRADQISVAGRLLRFSDVGFTDLKSDPSKAPDLASISASTGSLIAVTGYTGAAIHPGTAFGQPASGIRPDAGVDFPGANAFVLVDDANNPRYPARDGGDGPNHLLRAEVLQLLRSAIQVANHARAQIRQPFGTTARVTVSVVDTQGTILGVVRSEDAPIFGIDVSLQKARAAAFFTSASAAAYMAALPDARNITLDASGTHVQSVSLPAYTSAARTFLADTSAFGDGAIAYSVRALGGLSRPLYPDGIDGTAAGPFSKPQGAWSPLSTGLQLDLSVNAILQHVLHVAGAPLADVAPGCTGVDLASDLSSAVRVNSDLRLGNGLQIFAGGVPIFRQAILVGGIGVSGDGVDQDDMVAFLGLGTASQVLRGSISNAPAAQRADTLRPQGTRLKYVECPQAPFVDSSAEDACAGL